MSSPFNPGRDSAANPNVGFDEVTSTVGEQHLGSFQDAFRPPAPNNAEADYRTPDQTGGASPNQGSSGSSSPRRFVYPSNQPGGGVV